MEPYGGDCLEAIFCLWILMLNKKLRTQKNIEIPPLQTIVPAISQIRVKPFAIEF